MLTYVFTYVIISDSNEFKSALTKCSIIVVVVGSSTYFLFCLGSDECGDVCLLRKLHDGSFFSNGDFEIPEVYCPFAAWDWECCLLSMIFSTEVIFLIFNWYAETVPDIYDDFFIKCSGGVVLKLVKLSCSMVTAGSLTL